MKAETSPVFCKGADGNPIYMADVQALIDTYYDDPVNFVHEILNIPILDPYFQPQLLESVLKHDKIAIKGGKGCGKTRTLACLAIWWMCTRPGARVVLSAITFTQAKESLFGYVAQFIPESRVKNWFNLTASSACLFGSQTFFIGPVGNNPKSAAGHGKHAESMLVIVDECEEFTTDQFNVAEGNVTDIGAKIIASGNPTKLHVPFHKIFNEWSRQWTCQITVDSRKCMFVKPGWGEEYIETHGGIDSDMTRANVLGEFPKSSLSSYISQKDLTDCRRLKLPLASYSKSSIVLGCDLAFGGGDRVTIALRQARKLLYLEAMPGKPTGPEIEARILKLAELYKPAKFCFDGTGGAKIWIDQIKLHLPAGSVMSVNFSSRAHDPIRYPRMRDQIWGNMREAMREGGFDLSGISAESYESLSRELLSVEVGLDNKSREDLADKATIKKILGMSPDLGDAVALSFTVDPRNVIIPQEPERYSILEGEFGTVSGGGWMGQ